MTCPFFLWSYFPNLVDLRANFPKIKGPRPQVQEGKKIPECGDLEN